MPLAKENASSEYKKGKHVLFYSVDSVRVDSWGSPPLASPSLGHLPIACRNLYALLILRRATRTSTVRTIALSEGR